MLINIFAFCQNLRLKVLLFVDIPLQDFTSTSSAKLLTSTTAVPKQSSKSGPGNARDGGRLPDCKVRLMNIAGFTKGFLLWKSLKMEGLEKFCNGTSEFISFCDLSVFPLF